VFKRCYGHSLDFKRSLFGQFKRCYGHSLDFKRSLFGQFKRCYGHSLDYNEAYLDIRKIDTNSRTGATNRLPQRNNDRSGETKMCPLSTTYYGSCLQDIILWYHWYWIRTSEGEDCHSDPVGSFTNDGSTTSKRSSVPMTGHSSNRSSPEDSRGPSEGTSF
jgi:hypothetical protein